MTTEVISDGGSEILVGEVDRKSGTVKVIDRKLVHGRSTCHIEWDNDRTHLIAVSYWDSKITTFPVDSRGLLGEAATVYADPGAGYVDESKPDRWEHLAHRQRWPHLHQVNRDPYSQKFFMVPDLGGTKSICSTSAKEMSSIWVFSNSEKVPGQDTWTSTSATRLSTSVESLITPSPCLSITQNQFLKL
eukprot:TRINITY_DN9979_c0_g1_i1.p1 TRINITY_DN9979_c0_g1~~TRINITY_DN9979_c0_g1_i1.p1  ORF type:complete len:189 (+),score=33.67 TRINITY_DN9979_c0_g1_i1:138-704(+)